MNFSKQESEFIWYTWRVHAAGAGTSCACHFERTLLGCTVHCALSLCTVHVTVQCACHFEPTLLSSAGTRPLHCCSQALTLKSSAQCLEAEVQTLVCMGPASMNIPAATVLFRIMQTRKNWRHFQTQLCTACNEIVAMDERVDLFYQDI